MKVRIAVIDAPEKPLPFGRRSCQALADLCHRETATIRSTTLDKYGSTVAGVQCLGQDVGCSFFMPPSGSAAMRATSS